MIWNHHFDLVPKFCSFWNILQKSIDNRMTRLGHFPPIGLLLEAYSHFLKTWISTKIGYFSATFCSIIFFTFSPGEMAQSGHPVVNVLLENVSKHGLIKVFQGFKRWFDVNVLDFQIKLWSRYFGKRFGYISKNCSIFSHSSGHPGWQQFPPTLSLLSSQKWHF